MNNNKLGIYYAGGTGGYYALWLALLGTDYKCSFNNFPYSKDNNNFDVLYQHFWHKKNSQGWAYQEIEVDFEHTENSLEIDKKVFLVCNEDWYYKSVDQKIAIYTDTYTQSMLAIEKQSGVGIFSNIDVNNKNLLKEAAVDLSSLLPSFEFENKRISSYYKDKIDIDNVDAAFDLVDLVKNNGKPLLDFLGYTDIDNKCKKFTEHYFNLHSTTTQELFK